jgi:hypothetical protein
MMWAVPDDRQQYDAVEKTVRDNHELFEMLHEDSIQ